MLRNRNPADRRARSQRVLRIGLACCSVLLLTNCATRDVRSGAAGVATGPAEVSAPSADVPPDSTDVPPNSTPTMSIIAEGEGDVGIEYGFDDPTAWRLSGSPGRGQECVDLTLGADETHACFSSAENLVARVDTEQYSALIGLVGPEYLAVEIRDGDGASFGEPSMHPYGDGQVFWAVVPRDEAIQVWATPDPEDELIPVVQISPES